MILIMDKLNSMFHKLLPSIQLIFSIIWLSNLAGTDAYFSIYVLIFAFSLFLQFTNYEKVAYSSKAGSWFVSVFSVLFSFAVLLANYPLFTAIGDPALISRSTSILVNIINSIFSFLGGISVVYPILRFFFHQFPLCKSNPSEGCFRRGTPLVLFFALIALNCVHLFLVEYPGNLTEDTFTQISEMVKGEYSNFNTFWHTMLFRTVLSVGYSLFNDINAAAAFFCVIQMFVLNAAFVYSLVTMYRMGVPKLYLAFSFCLFAFMPYNMALSITIWKDVLFAAGCLLLISSWLRILKGVGKFSADLIVFVLGSFLFILSRTNGWMIYLVCFAVQFFASRRNKRFLFTMCAMTVLGWFLLNPTLKLLNIPGGDLVESLSVPIQQVSRVIVDECPLSEEEEALLSKIVDLEEVPLLYTNWLSDPMKVEVRSKAPEYLEQHIDAYAKLWIQLGMKYPASYVKAWVDQTKGYWNAGYGYALYSETVTENPYGVEKTGGNNPVASLFRLYFGLSRHLIFFEPLHSIGLHVWIVILCFFLNMLKEREEWIVFLPVLLLVIGLWFGTPVYCSFRYVYPLFVSFPLLLSTALYSYKNS